MNKQTFIDILEVALLKNDNMSDLRITSLIGNLQTVKAGIKLCDYLNQLNLEVEIK